MAIETATYINGLNPANPAGGDARSTADDHLRMIKATLRATFPNINGSMNATESALNKVGVTAAVGDSSTDPASTAFVMNALATQSMNGAMTMRVSNTVSTNAEIGEHIILTNGSASTVLLPAAPAIGSRVWVTGANGVAGNVLQRNSALLDGAGADFTIGQRSTVKVRYVSAPVGWVVESDRTNQAWASITGKPTTIAGYGITDLAAQTLPMVVDNAASTFPTNAYDHLLITNYNIGTVAVTLPNNPTVGRRIYVLFTNGLLTNKIYPGGVAGSSRPIVLPNGTQVGVGESLTIDVNPHLIFGLIFCSDNLWRPI